MDKQEFLAEMIKFGKQLIENENKPKINIKARDILAKLYVDLDTVVNAAANLEVTFGVKDKRSLTAQKAVSLIMEVQNLLNPLAEDKDIVLT